MNFEEGFAVALALVAVAWVLWRGFNGKGEEATAPVARAGGGSGSGFVVQTHH